MNKMAVWIIMRKSQSSPLFFFGLFFIVFLDCASGGRLWGASAVIIVQCKLLL